MALVVIPNTLCHPSSCGWHWGLGVLRGLSSIFLSPAATSQEPVSMAGKCDTIYKGFAGCLLSLGDSMAQSVRRSWDDFHACATEVLSNCPEEAAAIWESLRQESRKIQFQGNLQELCSARGRVAMASDNLLKEIPFSIPFILVLLYLVLLTVIKEIGVCREERRVFSAKMI
uniref:Neuritin 1 like n=1 Tax=Buteo japonicus TaxID=224669 RepID=A0A8C0HDX6_9AVES